VLCQAIARPDKLTARNGITPIPALADPFGAPHPSANAAPGARRPHTGADPLADGHAHPAPHAGTVTTAHAGEALINNLTTELEYRKLRHSQNPERA
jgi:hypothetical protein